ncbi:hypothetical protein BDR26DRAFT_920328 [Obelidium mucronatum]|nr:hypothetical protein BDR26DRAFT_920328 [Obelidium mucronatum]
MVTAPADSGSGPVTCYLCTLTGHSPGDKFCLLRPPPQLWSIESLKEFNFCRLKVLAQFFGLPAGIPPFCISKLRCNIVLVSGSPPIASVRQWMLDWHNGDHRPPPVRNQHTSNAARLPSARSVENARRNPQSRAVQNARRNQDARAAENAHRNPVSRVEENRNRDPQSRSLENSRRNTQLVDANAETRINDTILSWTRPPQVDAFVNELSGFDRHPNIATAMFYDQARLQHFGQTDDVDTLRTKILAEKLTDPEMMELLKKYNSKMDITSPPPACASCGCRRFHQKGHQLSMRDVVNSGLFKMTEFQLDRHLAIPSRWHPMLGVFKFEENYYNLHPHMIQQSANGLLVPFCDACFALFKKNRVATYCLQTGYDFGDLNRALEILGFEAINDWHTMALARIVTHQLLYKLTPRAAGHNRIALTGHVLSTPISSSLYETTQVPNLNFEALVNFHIVGDPVHWAIAKQMLKDGKFERFNLPVNEVVSLAQMLLDVNKDFRDHITDPTAFQETLNGLTQEIVDAQFAAVLEAATAEHDREAILSEEHLANNISKGQPSYSAADNATYSSTAILNDIHITNLAEISAGGAALGGSIFDAAINLLETPVGIRPANNDNDKDQENIHDDADSLSEMGMEPDSTSGLGVEREIGSRLRNDMGKMDQILLGAFPFHFLTGRLEPDPLPLLNPEPTAGGDDVDDFMVEEAIYIDADDYDNNVGIQRSKPAPGAGSSKFQDHLMWQYSNQYCDHARNIAFKYNLHQRQSVARVTKLQATKHNKSYQTLISLLNEPGFLEKLKLAKSTPHQKESKTLLKKLADLVEKVGGSMDYTPRNGNPLFRKSFHWFATMDST